MEKLPAGVLAQPVVYLMALKPMAWEAQYESR
jgi:hypothetical protein